MPLDSPIDRATINQLSIDELDRMLDELRARRLLRVQKLERIAKVKADDGPLVVFMKFERAFKAAQKAIERLTEDEAKVEAQLNKARLLAMEMNH